MILKLQFSDKQYPRGIVNLEIKNVSGVYKNIDRLMRKHYATKCEVFIVSIEKTEKLFEIG